MRSLLLASAGCALVVPAISPAQRMLAGCGFTKPFVAVTVFVGLVAVLWLIGWCVGKVERWMS